MQLPGPAAQNPLRRERPIVPTPFAGRLVGEDLEMELSADTEGNYTGVLVHLGNRYQAKGKVRDAALHGTFLVGETAFGFRVQQQGDTFELHSDGAIHVLRPAMAPRQPRMAPDTSGLPPFLRAGTRFAYFSGSKTMPGASAQFVPDDKGGLTINGRNYRQEELEGSAGGGYTIYDVVHASAAGVALQQGSYVYADATLQTVTRAAAVPVVGDTQAVGEIWIHPARLAAMAEEDTPRLRVRRVRYPLDGREYDAITTQLQGPEGYWRNTYDLATGLLLVHTSCAIGKSILTQVGANMAGAGAGSTTVATMRFLGLRELALPWAGQALPEALGAGQRLTYRGEATNSLGQGIVAPWPHLAEFLIEQVNGGFALGRLWTRTDYGAGTPSESQGPIVLGAGQTSPLFIDPAVLRALRPQQRLDQDPLLRRELAVLGVDQGYVTIREHGPLDAVDTTYEQRTGIAVQIVVTQQQGPATIVYRVQLERGR
ncbi:MAG: hypothetical protein IPK26_01465 [Planctomycetes bacterium]|nr:hypothetical protein [Planctomycetota bacterium]